ncbi:hypothetical protein JCM3775_006049 [Rhodotorula graminis]|uniref:Uncharacterized protein n=1 Tax=Rhodotorula graminis (strain WP1) TaxID=578459 RepID=A0A194SA98_RHOGW|nr:uncharacterized protein RHOBADRAFT_41378 [Rhodotorula graminis WP1]KPV77385.1 hypothetical protein RHOBADRAFT_41378 [Rhodotorula graminis WP1]
MPVWSRTYVCCAVPLYNSGIYAILAQFLVISIVTGVLCFAAPSIISVTTPSFISYILGILCFVIAAAQLFGFIGVLRDKPRLFKSFLRINGLLVCAALLLALALIIISAVKHSAGVDQCTRLFSLDDTDSTARDICNVWTWIQVGIMGLLFVIVGLCELYFVAYTSIYASEQRLDHARYDSVYSTAAHEIRQSGLWDGSAAQPGQGRPSYAPGDSDELMTPGGYGGYGHAREGSRASGLRNELARGGGDEAYDAPPARATGGKLRKGGGAVQATSVVGYRDEEEYAPYDYGGDEGGFRPPGQSSETRRW